MRSPGRERTGAVCKITVVRDDLGMKEHGAVISARILYKRRLLSF